MIKARNFWSSTNLFQLFGWTRNVGSNYYASYHSFYICTRKKPQIRETLFVHAEV
ncbi:MAG TPA: hypothetical protein TECP_00293 [Hyphomicrobiaceae bacterium MAG_BT-2024]